VERLHELDFVKQKRLTLHFKSAVSVVVRAASELARPSVEQSRLVARGALASIEDAKLRKGFFVPPLEHTVLSPYFHIAAFVFAVCARGILLEFE